MKNVIPVKVLKHMLSVLCVGGLFLFASCGDDDPTPSPTISFSSSTASISEADENGLTVTVNFSRASSIAGTFAISITSSDATYGDDFTTSPEGLSGAISVTIAEGDESASVTLNTIDNDEFMGDKTVTFTLADIEGFDLGDNATITVTIVDDEVMATDISALRETFANQGASTIQGPAAIEGVVTSARDNITGRNLFLQDATGGIVVRFDEDNVDFDLGDALRVDISGGTLDEFGGLVQISDIALTSATETGTGTMPDPVDITITQLLTDDFQGQLIRLSDVAVEGADGTRVFDGGLTFIDVDGNEAGSFVRSGAAFNGTTIPTGTGTVVGIASSFSDTPQIDLRSDSDLDFTLTADITIDASNLTDFGTVLTNEVSASQSYTVSGTDLLADINVEAPSGFEISLDNQTFSDELTIDASSAAGGVTVHVRFAPTDNVSGAQNGDIQHSSFGAVSEDVAVSGTEEAPTVVIAFTSFEEPSTGDRYTDTGDASMDHDLVNNANEAMVDYDGSGNEMGFDATYVNTRDDVGLTDGDFVGVTDFTGTVTAFTDGTQGYQMSDTDGKMVVTFDAVDVSQFTTVTVMLDMFIQATSWEDMDAIRVYAKVDGDTEIDLYNRTEGDIDADEGQWNTVSADVSGNSTATLVFELDSNSSSEAVYFDKVQIIGQN